MAHLFLSRACHRLGLPRLDVVGLGGLEGRLPIVLGVVLAVAAAVLVYAGQQHARDQANAPEEVTPVVVAATTIPQGTLLTSSNIPGLFKVSRVPASGVSQDTISALTSLDGQVTATPLTAGDRLLASSVSTPADSTASGPRAALLPPGNVAIVLPVNDNISVGGAIVPTDRVDVIATMPLPGAGQSGQAGKASESVVTQAILRDVRVLATGFRTRPPVGPSGSQAQAPENNPTPYSTLTLALEPQDAVIVQHLLAQNVRLALALRRPGEQTVPTTAITSNEIVRRLGLTGAPTPAEPAAAAAQVVPAGTIALTSGPQHVLAAQTAP